jgi:hypothetical protein
MGHPSLERTPLSEPQSQRCPRLSTTEEMKLGGGYGAGAGWENACVIFEIPQRGNNRFLAYIPFHDGKTRASR